MADLRGRTFLITGANTGIGRETARALARDGATLFVTARSEQKGGALIDELTGAGAGEVHLLELDLGDLDSVRACAEEFLATGAPLHCLVNNAGLAGSRGLTQSGFELHFGTNHIGAFLLTQLLTDRLVQSAPARIVNVSSEGHYAAKGIDFEAVREPTRTRTGFPEYCVSKLANLLHIQELSRRLDGTGVTTYALHPGTVASDIWRRVPWPVRPLMKLRMRSPEEGARTSVHCATAPELENESGRYYEDCTDKRPSRHATPELAAELWERSEAWVAGS